MGFDLGSAEGGAQTAGSAGGPWAALAGGIIGGFMGGPKLPRELKNLYRLQYGLAGQLRDQSNSIPLSLPQEQAALASQRALGAEQFGNQTANLYNAWNQDTAGPGATADLMQNNANAFQGFQSSVSAEHLLAALNRRQQMKLQASQVAGNAASGVKDYQQPPDLSGLFGNIARLHAQQQGQNQGDGMPSFTSQAHPLQPIAGTTQQGMLPAVSFGGPPAASQGVFYGGGAPAGPPMTDQDWMNKAGAAGAFRF